MTLLALITNPPAHTALLTEIRSVITISPVISWSDIQSLPYLQAVVSEALRMWPPVAGLGFKTVSPEGDSLNGYFIPGGTEIGQGFHGVGRSKAVWGPDADVFRPERWLRAGGEELRKMKNAVDLHFGHGKYSCLGKGIALMELHKAVFEVRCHLRRSALQLHCTNQEIKDMRLDSSKQGVEEANLCLHIFQSLYDALTFASSTLKRQLRRLPRYSSLRPTFG